MYGSNRLFLAALAGLAALLVTFGIGLMLGASHNPEDERYKPYGHTADQPQRVESAATAQTTSHSFEYRTPCRDPNGEGESDLCAYWKAAIAAEDSASWAKWGFWIAVIGSGFLLWQVSLTRKAVEDTGEASSPSYS